MYIEEKKRRRELKTFVFYGKNLPNNSPKRLLKAKIGFIFKGTNQTLNFIKRKPLK